MSEEWKGGDVRVWCTKCKKLDICYGDCHEEPSASIKAEVQIERELTNFLLDFKLKDLENYWKDNHELFKLFDCDEDSDHLTVKEKFSLEDINNVRAIAYFVMMYSIAEKYAGKLSSLVVKYKKLYKILQGFNE